VVEDNNQTNNQPFRLKPSPVPSIGLLHVIDDRNIAVTSAIQLEQIRETEIDRIPPPVSGVMEPIHTNLGVDPDAVVRQVMKERSRQAREINRMQPEQGPVSFFQPDGCGISEHDQMHDIPSAEDVDQFRRWELAQVAETQRQIRAEETEQLNYYL
jgi:hypothetical protein